MIKSLRIKNVALIPELVIEFGKGLNILSGETGAGKSVIADSLGFVLGEKAETTLIRQGEDTMTAEAVFDAGAAREVLAGIGVESDEIIILKRTLNRAGKNEIFINGSRVALSMLKKLSSALIDIYGQSEHSGLLRPATHMDMTDAFGEGVAAQKEAVAALYADYKKTEKELRSFGGDAEARERQIGMLDFQIKEIEKVNVRQGEEDELLARRTRIVNTEKILTALKAALATLENERGASAQIKLAATALAPAASVDAEIEALRLRLVSVRHEADDICASLKAISEGFDYDEKTADKIENRLQEIRNIHKKYGRDLAAVNDFLAKATKEYERLTQAEDMIAELNKQLSALRKRLYSASLSLSHVRRAAAEKLQNEIKKELSDLGLSGGGIVMSFEEIPAETDAVFTPNGFDRGEFLFSANKGEDLRPLAKIISGGEMSRFMLAVKNVTARIFSLPVMFFDEIDAGISGRIAEKVAVKLAAVACGYQVISITHLPQIAAMGDINFLIEKGVQNDKTITSVKRLSAEEKIAEVARLSGGADLTASAHKHAEELIAWADGVKRNKQ